MKKFTSITAILLCTASMTFGQWTYTNLSEAKFFMGSATLGNKVWFAGGNNNMAYLSDVEVYDLVTGEWAPAGNLFVPRFFVGGSVSCGSKIFFAGGYDDAVTYNFVDIYDTELQEWSVELLSVDRFSLAAISHGDTVMFAGGIQIQGSPVFKNTVDIYNYETGAWAAPAVLSQARGGLAAAVVGNLAIFAGGWINTSGTTSNRVDIYNFTTKSWSQATLSQARAYPCAVTVGSKVIIAGGITTLNNPTDRVDIFDTETGLWTQASLSAPRSFTDNGATVAGKAYFAGGGTFFGSGFNNPFGVIDIYDPETNTWTVMNLQEPRVDHSVLGVGNYLVVAGGKNDSGLLSSVEIYQAESSSCLPEGITFTTQEEIDNFQMNYPGCTEIEGDVIISGYYISNLDGLSVLTSIGGTLQIGINNGGNHLLTSLTGIENLIFIGGDLLIGGTGLAGPNNPNLTSLAGLINLSYIGGDLKIYSNPVLTSIIGLEGLISIGGDILITTNVNLTNCAAQGICDYLASANGVVDIYNNGPGCNSQSEVAGYCGVAISCLPYGNYHFLSQTDIDNFQTNFPGCNELEGNFTISGNSITNLTGLNQIFSIGGNTEIKNCSGLTNFNGLNNISHIGGDVYVFHNESLINFSGLGNLVSISGSLEMYENDQLLSLSGLENLDSIGGWLNIGTIYNIGVPNPPPGGNALLVNLSSLESLTFVGGVIDIGKNNSLLSLAGLDNIDANTVTDLMIGNNSSLSTCDVQSICDYLASPNGTIEIYNNAPGCNSPEEVEEACLISIEETDIENQITLFPNPANKTISILNNGGLEIKEVSISNHMGQVVFSGKLVNSLLDVSNLQPGIYFIGIISPQTKTIRKLIIQNIK